MGFSAKQLKALRRNLDHRYVRTREANGRAISYIEGWYAISEANRIFGFDGWSRETIESRCVLARETRGSFLAVYAARVRISVQADGASIIREGHGTGEGRGTSAGEVHDTALKAAETDATKRALATFGKPFGLALYRSGNPTTQTTIIAVGADRRLGFHPDDTTPIPRPSRYYGRRQYPPLTEQLRRQASSLAPPLVPSGPGADSGRIDKSQLAQPRAIGLKVSDEFTVPLCRGHHRELHRAGNEAAWWQDRRIDPLEIAKSFWGQTHPKPALGAGYQKQVSPSRTPDQPDPE
jgi:DNA recombination protein Rad52